MLEVHRELLPNSFLLILSPDIGCDDNEVKLTRALHRASRSDKYAVLVDCSLVECLNEDAVDLLLAYSFMLHAQNRCLVMCHVPDPVRHHFLHLDEPSQPLLALSLLDAVQEINQRAEPPAAGRS
jgi:anti-anti-sigma regulatory factor